MTLSVERVVNNQDLRRSRFMSQDALERILVQRALGEHVVYGSIWIQRENGREPLRYQINTVSGSATGNVTITFHQKGIAGCHPSCLRQCAGCVASRPGDQQGKTR